ncbi:hypothetical protein EXU48_15710 [Occultella glacieicola]|uniref:Tip attachment protein J domain-containing protein n=1 Tax=Occultella glacieicola TaxID=2518684 RepID=A0ABY2E1Z3_9MICO|nr:hypothetical protein [Occultella glacieicola]TDE91590.1 hypothetical protein EXU48_15710 [Occultella glacieicola]
MTAPFMEQAATAINEPITHVWRIEAWPPGATEGIPLAVNNGTLTYDEAWAPHVQASLQCQVPTDQATLDALDPRTNCRIHIYLGYVYQRGTEDVHLIADLGLFARTVNRPQNTMDLSAMSDEIRLLSNAWLGGAQPPKTGAAEALVWTINAGLDPINAGSIDTQIGTEVAADQLTELAIGYGDSYGSLFTTIQDSTETWAYCPGAVAGHWVIRYRPTLAGRSAAQFTTGPGGNVFESEADLSREDWHNAVLVRHRWKDTGGTDHEVRGIAVINSGAHGAVSVGRHVLTIDRTTPTSQSAADAAAAAKVRRTISRGRQFNVSVPAAYWVRPGHTVTIQLPTGPQERHLVASVEFRFPSGDMSVRTRVPENVTITEGE